MGVKRRVTGLRLRVDPVLCDGYGHCHELAPELVTMDEWGYPIIKAEPTPYENASVYESARYAVRGCPRQALNIERISEK